MTTPELLATYDDAVHPRLWTARHWKAFQMLPSDKDRREFIDAAKIMHKSRKVMAGYLPTDEINHL